MDRAIPDFEAMTDEQLSAWAESEAPSKTPGHVLRGHEADDLVRSMLDQRPNLDEQTVTGRGRSVHR